MAEYTREHKNGTMVEGTTTSGDNFPHGIVCGFDEDDGQYEVLLLPVEGKSFGDTDSSWCEGDEIRKTTNVPKWLSAHPSHAFVYDWMDDHVANVSLHAEPEDIITAYFSDVTPDEQANLRLKLMEAIADPGERVELIPGGGAVRFCVVNG